MRHCIPDELFNRIPRPPAAGEDVGIDAICREILYKLPGAEDVAVRREAWHTLCDFCGRTGALRVVVSGEQEEGQDFAPQLSLSSVYGDFLWVSCASADNMPTVDFAVQEQDGQYVISFNGDNITSCEAVFAVRPKFSDARRDSGTGDWAPMVPQYMVDRYGECIAHGALARLYAMRGDGGMARMHATAYNNDLNRLSFGLITSGMRKHLLIDVEDWLVNTNGNG